MPVTDARPARSSPCRRPPARPSSATFWRTDRGMATAPMSIVSFRLLGRLARQLSLASLLLLAACTSTGQMTGEGLEAGLPPAPDQYGTGARVVGVMAFAEPGNLSDGNPDSVALAARLAATTIKGNPVTVLVRPLSPTADNAGTIVSEFEAATASLVIGPDNEAIAATVATIMSVRAVPTLSLTSFSDIAIHLYGAGYVPNEEAVALVNEAAKRGLTSLAVISAPGHASESFTKSVLSLAGAAGIAVRPVDGSTDSQFVAGLGGMVSAGVAVSAVVFATG